MGVFFALPTCSTNTISKLAISWYVCGSLNLFNRYFSRQSNLEPSCDHPFSMSQCRQGGGLCFLHFFTMRPLSHKAAPKDGLVGDRLGEMCLFP